MQLPTGETVIEWCGWAVVCAIVIAATIKVVIEVGLWLIGI